MGTKNALPRKWASRRRQEPMEMLGRLKASIPELDQAGKEAESRAEAVLLMRQLAVGPVTALAFVLTIGPASILVKGSGTSR